MVWNVEILKYLIVWDLAAGIIFSVVKSPEMDFIAGLVIGTLTLILNYRLLRWVIDNLTRMRSIIRTISAMSLYIFRMLIFLVTIYVSVKISFCCALGYSISVIGFSLIIVITNLRGDVK